MEYTSDKFICYKDDIHKSRQWTKTEYESLDESYTVFKLDDLPIRKDELSISFYFPILAYTAKLFRNKKRITLKNLSKILNEEFPNSPDNIEMFIRAELAVKANLKSVYDNKRSIELGTVRKTYEKTIGYYSELAEELCSKSRRIELLIGHGGTKGTYREELLMSTLRMCIPKKFKVSSGFIYGLENQIDILVFDHINYPVYFDEGGTVVVDSESVRGIIEVKSKFSKSKLKDALRQVHNSYSELSKLPIFKAVFFFDENDIPLQNLSKYFSEFYNQKGTPFLWANNWKYEVDKHVLEASESIIPVLSQPYETVDYVGSLGTGFLRCKWYSSKDKENFPQPYINIAESTNGDRFGIIQIIQDLLEYLDLERRYKKRVYNFGVGFDLNLLYYDPFPLLKDDFSARGGYSGGGLSSRESNDVVNSINSWVRGEVSIDSIRNI